MEETVSTQESFAGNTFEEWEENNSNLEGSIKELQEGQFTVFSDLPGTNTGFV